jgi:ribose 1,5-bisphosphokinase PhnN
MIIWINGAFGAGKSTVAAALRERIPGARFFDPEYVGYLLAEFADVPTGDFQDLPLWRRLVVETGYGLVTEVGSPLVTPMTVLDSGYRAELFGGLRERGVRVVQVVLSVPEPVLRIRIDADETLPPRARAWRHAHVERALGDLSALHETEQDTVRVENGAAVTPVAVAAELAALLALDGQGAAAGA